MKSKTNSLPELNEESTTAQEPQPYVAGTLKAPMRGNDVKILQSMLLKRGYLKSLSDVDGIFLAITTTAVKNFQADNGLTVDGIAGAFTLSKLGIGVTQTPQPSSGNTWKQYEDGTPEFYKAAFAGLSYDAGFETGISNAAKKVISNRERYQDVVNLIGVKYPQFLEMLKVFVPGVEIEPWKIIGGIHNMESSQSFAGVLHNGEKIIGTGKKTTLVPAGRGPFATWVDAALDALALKSFQKLPNLNVETVLQWAERYNGTGYLTGAGKNEYSPYLWAQSSINDNAGKYVKDGKFDANANANGQVGFCTLIREVNRQLGVASQPPVVETPVNTTLAEKIAAANDKIPKRAIELAMKHLENKAIGDRTHLTIVDWDRHESLDRFWLIDAATGATKFSEKVALGNKSDLNEDGYLDQGGLSNVNGSNKSSAGAILVGPKFTNPKWKYVWLLYGLEPNLNGNIQKREILLHSTLYVNDTEGKAIGETLGCLGLSEAAAARVAPYVKDTLIYCYSKQVTV